MSIFIPNRRIWIGAWLAAVVAIPAGAQDSPRPRPIPDGPVCRVKTFLLNAHVRELDGQWEGMIAAGDGQIYFASSTHSGERGGVMFRYNPKADKLDLLTPDITRECGENPVVNPQGKIHSPIVEHRGWIYLATHYSSDKKGSDKTYTGAHVLGIELATGKFRDFGAIHPGHTIYSGLAVDPARNRLFVHVTPITGAQAMQDGAGTRIYAIDIASGEKKDLGVLSRVSHDHSFWFFVDRRGDCWFTLGSARGALFRVRGEDLKIDRYPDALAKLNAAASGSGMRIWGWAGALPDRTQCLFTLTDSGMLWKFDPTKPLESPDAFKPVKEIGPSGLGMAMGAGRVYWIQRAARQAGNKADDQHLVSLALDTLTLTDHGLILDQDGRRPWRAEGMAVAPDGAVYFTGDWFMKEGEKGTLRYTERDGKAGYRELHRGQCFAVWRPAAP